MFGTNTSLATVALLCLFAATAQALDKGASLLETSQLRRKLTFDGRVSALEFYNADKDTKILDLSNGTVVNVKDIPDMSSPSFNINAKYSGSVRSVKYLYDNSFYRVDSVAPFAFCVNNRNDFSSCRKLGCGNHTVTAVPYSREDANGEAGSPYTVSFSIVCAPPTPPKALKITGINLVNADNDTKVVDLANGTVVSLKDFPGMSSPSFSTNASYEGAVVSVAYWYNDTFYRVEEIAPFSFCGNDRSNFFPCRNLGCGTHTIKAIPYPRNGAQGEAGWPWQVTFSIACTPVVVPDAPKAPPVAPPVPAPMAPPVPAPMAPPTAPTPPACPACTPSNACFNTSCDAAGKCIYTPTKTCPAGQSCDVRNGNCLSQNDLRPCIGVIDESDNLSDDAITKKWNEFRVTYPNRPFCLLQPVATTNNRLFLPPTFLNDTNAIKFNVTREDSTTPVLPRSPLADWYSLCKIDIYAATGVSFVGLFIDTSGSMTAATVKNMTANFLLKLNQTGLAYKTLLNGNEDWILPFQTDLSTL